MYDREASWKGIARKGWMLRGDFAAGVDLGRGTWGPGLPEINLNDKGYFNRGYLDPRQSSKIRVHCCSREGKAYTLLVVAGKQATTVV